MFTELDWLGIPFLLVLSYLWCIINGIYPPGTSLINRKLKLFTHRRKGMSTHAHGGPLCHCMLDTPLGFLFVTFKHLPQPLRTIGQLLKIPLCLPKYNIVGVEGGFSNDFFCGILILLWARNPCKMSEP